MTFLAGAHHPHAIEPSRYIFYDFIKESAEVQAVVDKVIIHGDKIRKAQKVFRRFMGLRSIRLDFMKAKMAEYLKQTKIELFQAKATSKAQKEKNK